MVHDVGKVAMDNEGEKGCFAWITFLIVISERKKIWFCFSTCFVKWKNYNENCRNWFLLLERFDLFDVAGIFLFIFIENVVQKYFLEEWKNMLP